MGKRPALEAYPHLHSVLKNDPTANAQFQACLSAAIGQGGSPGIDEIKLKTDLEKMQSELSKLVAKHQKLLQTADKAKRVIKLLGGIVEPQLQLKPYVQDISEEREYIIKFSPRNIRLFLQMHWDLISQETEDVFYRAL